MSANERMTIEAADVLACKIMTITRKHAEAGNEEARRILVEALIEACRENKELRDMFGH